MKISNSFNSPAIVHLSPELERLANKTPPQTNFGDLLVQKLGEVDALQKTADETVASVATGKSQNLHGAILALEMADTSLRLVVTVRNKALEAYQEIMRMPG